MIPVSLVISTYNRANSLSNALASIYAQAYPELEVIVVDDGSTEETKKVCEKYPIRYYCKAKHDVWGQGVCTNFGIKMATHDIIIMQGADIVHEDMDISKLVDAVSGDENLWVLAAVRRSEDNSWMCHSTSATYTNGARAGNCPRSAFYLSALWRKKLVAIRGFDEDYVEGWGNDGDLADRLLMTGVKQVFRNDIRGVHQQHPALYDDTSLRIRSLFEQKSQALREGKIGVVRNPLGWGEVVLPPEPVTVSIVMSAWNRAQLLERGLRSIFDQQYPGLEVIVVDDGSTDDTALVCSRYPVRYFYRDRPEWSSQGPAQNLGFKMARGDIVIMQNPEVVHLQTDTISRLVEAIRHDDKLWVMANVVRQTSEGSTSTINGCSVAAHRPCNFFLSALWRKWLLEIHGFDEDYTNSWRDDDDLADRLLSHCGLRQLFTDDIRGLHLWHPDLSRPDDTLYKRKTAEMAHGTITAIRNGEWIDGPTLSIIIPTCGRPTLRDTLSGIASQVHAGDEVILVGDRPLPAIRPLVEKFQREGLSIFYSEVFESLSQYGNVQRDYGMMRAHNPWLLFMDDDDIFSRNALAVIRGELRNSARVPHLFSMWYDGDGIKLWKTQAIVKGNISTQMFVVPRRGDLPAWSCTDKDQRWTDYRWFNSLTTTIFSPGQVIWHPEVTCHFRPRPATLLGHRIHRRTPHE